MATSIGIVIFLIVLVVGVWLFVRNRKEKKLEDDIGSPTSSGTAATGSETTSSISDQAVRNTGTEAGLPPNTGGAIDSDTGSW
jgi:hypothetical protein